MPEPQLRIEHAELSLVGDREDNQDRVSVAVNGPAALMIVIDGMGGHSDGGLAADTALQSLLQSFAQTTAPLFDPIGFLHLSLSKAHDEVARLGSSLSVDFRPRATIAICLVQEGFSYWAHIGDSRIYLIRQGRVKRRTRDHSHVELLLQEGKIAEAEVANHPMRNFVECCLGGDPAIPEMALSSERLQPTDVLLVCSDGIWANLSDQDIATFFPPELRDLRFGLGALGQRAVQAAAPFSDNSTAAVLRWQGTSS